MEILLLAPELAGELRIITSLQGQFPLSKYKSVPHLILKIEEYTSTFVLIDLDAFLPDTLAEFLNKCRRSNPQLYFIGLTQDKSEFQVKVNAPFKIMIFDYSAEDQHELYVMLNRLWQYESNQPNEESRKQTIRYIGVSDAMKRLMKQADYITDLDVHILLTGETGCGKTELARYIHSKSKRRNAPFLDLNCAAIPDNLLESELFGHKKGAFTGADRDKQGMFRAARNGTICLDEIGEIPLHLQSKLLKVLDEKQYYPVGSIIPENVSARIIAATNTDIAKALREKKFREDLYYRLNIVELYIPPLRERKEDIPALFDFLLAKHSRLNNMVTPQVDPIIYDVLQEYEWRGNIRELENKVKILLSQHPAIIKNQDLPVAMLSMPRSLLIKDSEEYKTMDQMKKHYARLVHEINGRKLKKTARILGINVKTARALLTK
jgi:transcriptional regulator with PAS, ATPase and Fis domain